MIEGVTNLSRTDPRQLGPFRLQEVLGTGGMGTVYLGRGAAQRGGRKQLTAVRAVRPELLRERALRARLRHEIQTSAAGARSPYVAAALGCELDSEKPWLAAEFVPGPSLAAVISRYGPMPEGAVRALGGALCRALLHLHSARIIHRDLRPGNVLLSHAAPKAVDHGLGLGRTDLGAADDEAGDPAGDIFDLGALLVFAACAHQPFAGSMLPSAREGPDLTGVPAGLHPALLACLHKTPESRPQPGTLARALDLEDRAETPAAGWLPEAYVHEIDTYAEAARRLGGRRLFGR